MKDFVIRDISKEEFREYDFLNGSVYRIEKPVKLYLKENSGHRIVDADGVTHYIPKINYIIRWKRSDEVGF